MIKAYINYPNPHLTIHAESGCATIQQQHKKEQRVACLNIGSLSRELDRFARKEYRFGAQAEINDMWLDVNLGDATFERAVVEYIRTLLAQYYSPFARVKVDEHC